MGLTTRPRQPASDQLAIEPLGQWLAELDSAGIVRSVVISSIKRLLQRLLRFG
jgi:hypothetical protein